MPQRMQPIYLSTEREDCAQGDGKGITFRKYYCQLWNGYETDDRAIIYRTCIKDTEEKAIEELLSWLRDQKYIDGLSYQNLSKNPLKGIKNNKDNKPKYSPDLKNWFAERGTLEIQDINGKKIWTYTNSVGDSVPYIDGYVNFPKKYLYSDIGEINIGSFSGNRTIDNAKLLEVLKNDYGIIGIPKGYIPHHDVNKGIIQLVEKSIHSQFTHIGGHSLHGGK